MNNVILQKKIKKNRIQTIEFKIFLKWNKSYIFVTKNMTNFKITLLFVCFFTVYDFIKYTYYIKKKIY